MDNLTKSLNYLINPQHPITINLIGCGATGSEVIRHLAKMNGALHALGHAGFHVVASDPDTIGIENIYRQPFTEQELGLNKASQLISKINRSFGTQWQSTYLDWNLKKGERMPKSHCANITISCVDKVPVRKQIQDAFHRQQPAYGNHSNPIFWIDFGNGFDFGQVVLMDIFEMPENRKNTPEKFKSILDIYPDMQDHAEEPSCSLAVSLGRQDLFINSILADLGMRMLWNILRTASITKNAIFVNMKNDNPVRYALMLKAPIVNKSA